jgi:hypothetical protein
MRFLWLYRVKYGLSAVVGRFAKDASKNSLRTPLNGNLKE